MFSLLIGFHLNDGGQAHLNTELLTRQAHLLQETFAGVHTGIGSGSRQTTCIDVALPVSTHNHTTFAIHHASSQDGICTLGIDLHEQQSRSPTKDGMT